MTQDAEQFDGILLCGIHTVRFGGGYCRVCYLENKVAALEREIMFLTYGTDDESFITRKDANPLDLEEWLNDYE